MLYAVLLNIDVHFVIEIKTGYFVDEKSWYTPTSTCFTVLEWKI